MVLLSDGQHGLGDGAARHRGADIDGVAAAAAGHAVADDPDRLGDQCRAYGKVGERDAVAVIVEDRVGGHRQLLSQDGRSGAR